MESTVVDFAQVKAVVSMETVVSYLGLELKKGTDALRGCCPLCEGDNPRAFVVTPSKQVWYSFCCEVGGDCIELYARAKKLEVKAAAIELDKHFRTTPPETSLEPLGYLVSDHPAVAALGFSEDVADALGVGYAMRGVCRGRVAIPLRLPSGKLAGYIAVNLAHDDPIWLPKKWKLGG